MKRSLNATGLAGLFAAILFTGCFGEPETAEKPAPPTPPAGPTATPASLNTTVPLNASPDKVILTFLDSLKRGDDGTAATLLTDIARAETAKADLIVGPQGTPNATYSIGGVNYVDENQTGAQVVCTCRDQEPDGTPYSYDVSWVMRRQPNGWRIVGFTTAPGGGDRDIFLNFENPQEMLDKVKRADAELAEAEPARPLR